MKFDRRLTDEIYTSDTVRLGKDAFQAMQETIYHNGGVGTIAGYYDAELSILSVSDLLLHNLNHSYASLMEQTKGSLKNLFYKKDGTFLDNARFRQLQGEGEGRILTADGSPVYVRLYKKDAVDTDGTPIWIMSVQMNWAYENLALVNESIHSALWYFECNENGEIVHVNWSHAFRQILGYHDILDFPNKLDSWSNLLHPEDYDRVMQLLLETIADKTNTTKYNVEYRLKMQDGQYHWFRASAEVIRRLDGSANRIAGIISNIDAEKRSRMQAQRAAAFHRAFTSANLCEYYVNLEKNTFDTFKVEPSLMTAFEQNHTWDGLVRFLVDNYVVEEDKKSVTDFYNRAYITEKLKGLETELRQECRIVLDGEERWVSNVVMRGEIEDSELKDEMIRVIRGKSSIDRDMIQQLLDENQAAIQAAQDALTAAQNKLEEIEQENKKAENDCSNLFTWASTYQNASFQQRQAILNQFIKEVRVGRDYNIEIVLNVPLDEFEEFKRHAASAGRGKNQKNKSQNPQKVGRCTSNAGIVVLDKTAGETISIVPKNAAHAILRC
mgnify:CR=1 FL=1